MSAETGVICLLDLERQVEEVVARHGERTGDVLGILEELQQQHPNKYLPTETLELVAEKMGVPRSQIFSVVTFYSFFNLSPQGKHTLMVCRGTACHTRGSKALHDALLRSAGKRQTESEQEAVSVFTTPDHRMTVRTVACFGQCALAPVVAVDEEIYGYASEMKLKEILDKIEKQEDAP